MFGIARFALIFASTAALWACGGQSDDVTAPSGTVSRAVPIAQVDTDRIAAAAEEPEMWLTYGGSYDEQRHSGLGQINRDTLPELGVGWVYALSRAVPRRPRLLWTG